MKIQKTLKRIGYSGLVEGKGVVLVGENPITGEWVEKWFADEQKAKNYADKKGWTIEG